MVAPAENHEIMTATDTPALICIEASQNNDKYSMFYKSLLHITDNVSYRKHGGIAISSQID